MGRSGYSAVVAAEDGTVEVQLEADHPGFLDPVYRARRNDIAKASTDYRTGDPIPLISYTDQENEIWRIVSEELAPKHDKYACAAFLDAKDRVGLPTERIPQLAEVTERLSPQTGFGYEPVAGLAPLREFYGAFARQSFYSTQYIRHPSVPQYTPEPDIVHEVIGHANQLADTRFAAICVEVGRAVERTQSQEALGFLSRVFWFTLEFGVVWEDGELRTYGAGLLSSIGELDEFRNAEIRPINFAEMGTAVYDITHYQPVLYSLSSMSELEERLTTFYSSYDDATYADFADSGK
ncbi:MAG TPA: phenylalanine 4-monooxygenase [Acidimicrobiales bacterium]|nr:phenylalanine 4-monooxygenase [Acidimicrobiales bacterium]